MSSNRKQKLCKKAFAIEETYIQLGRLKKILEERKNVGVDVGTVDVGTHSKANQLRVDSPARNTRSVVRRLLIREDSPEFEQRGSNVGENNLCKLVDRNEALQSPIASPTAPIRRFLRLQGVKAFFENNNPTQSHTSEPVPEETPIRRSLRLQGVEASPEINNPTQRNTSAGALEPEETPIWISLRVQGVEEYPKNNNPTQRNTSEGVQKHQETPIRRSRRLQEVEASPEVNNQSQRMTSEGAQERDEITTDSIGKSKNPNGRSIKYSRTWVQFRVSK
ncbi:uncharacterized protein LOC112090649 [Morus notabilis]|uniref:uncharacterized protein LOC112090649 n=1 Tax=Morus notabilis TaxID=981085 RepID=UPI000CED5683|nr:uncharacterized protein LOC112090649 [Morus notabilis]